MAVTIDRGLVDGWAFMSPAERQVALEDYAAAGLYPLEPYSLEQANSPMIGPAGSAPTTSTGWWGSSIFSDLVGETGAIDPATVRASGDGGMFGLPGLGLLGNGGELTRNGWLFVALGLGVITLAVITRR